MIVDQALVRRLEASAARVAAATASVMADQHDDATARHRVWGTGALVAFGPGQYVNRGIGVTLDDLDDTDLADIDSFFASAAVPAALEVCSWAPAGLLDRLSHGGYTPRWFRNVFVRRVDDPPPVPPPTSSGRRLTLHPVGPHRLGGAGQGDNGLAAWQQMFAFGNEVTTPEGRAVADRFTAATHGVAGAIDLIARVDGSPVGCGSLVPGGGVGWLGASATVPEHRGAGVQSALLAQRIGLAGERGCDLVAATALPASASARNLLRVGFVVAYPQVVMVRS